MMRKQGTSKLVRGDYAVPALLLLLLVLAFVYYAFSQYRSAFQHAKSHLQIVANIKSEQMGAWYRERYEDGKLILNNSILQRDSLQMILNPSNKVARKQVELWVQRWQIHSRYENFILFRQNGEVVFASHDNPQAQQVAATLYLQRDFIRKIARNYRDILFTGPYLTSTSNNGPIIMGLVIPVLDQIDGSVMSTGFWFCQIHVYDLRELILENSFVEEFATSTHLAFKNEELLSLIDPRSDHEMRSIPVAQAERTPLALVLRESEGVTNGLDWENRNQIIADVRMIPATDLYLITRLDEAIIKRPFWKRLMLEAFIVIMTMLSLFFWGRVIAKGRERDWVYQQQKNEHLVNAIFDNIPSGMAIHELILDSKSHVVDYRLVKVNASYEKHTGIKAEEAIGFPATKVYGQTVPPYAHQFFGAVQSGRVSCFETYFEPLGRHFAITVVPLNLESFATIFEDITEQKQREEEVKRLNSSLEQRVRERTEQLRQLVLELTQTEYRERKKLADVIHDHLQQLLVAAKMAVVMGQKKLGQQGVHETYLERVTQLLDESIKASKSLTTELSPPILHEAGLIAALKWLARWMDEHYGLRVEIQSGLEIRPYQEDNTVLLIFQSVRELLFNVVKHANVKQAKVSLKRLSDTVVQIEVCDHGKGCDPEKVFTSDGGYGLFAIRQRLSILGGSLHFSSQVEKGTDVILLVPLALPELLVLEDPTSESVLLSNEEHGAVEEVNPWPIESADESAAIIPALEPSTPTRSGPQPPKIRVVVVDDHKMVREGLIQLLSGESGIEIVGEAADGQSAVGLVNCLRPDVVIMDINLPVMNGIEATRQIVAQQPQIKVIAVSMHEDADLASAMFAAGAIGYFHKATASQNLIDFIKNA